jgi:hypothetical protein
MSQLELKRVSKEVIDHVEKSMVADQGLSKAVDDFFIQLVKQEEMQHPDINPKLYDSLRGVVRQEVLPLYEQYRKETARIRERRQNRKLWQYVLGTVAFIEGLELILTRGRSMAPQVLIPTVILNSFLGFIIYGTAQYFDDLLLRRARKRLEVSLDSVESRAVTDVMYDDRRQLMDADLLRAEALEILTHYEDPEAFWRDYTRVREADPTLPGELRKLEAPAFEKFLRFHLEGQLSAPARQNRFNRLFVEAQELFVSRDRENYALSHLKKTKVQAS